ncbi:MAG: hypothetical protein KBG84_02730 [Planctomycetes bacterium]|nr:hypothetical protein [Planctomycetota bacterium]
MDQDEPTQSRTLEAISICGFCLLAVGLMYESVFGIQSHLPYLMLRDLDSGPTHYPLYFALAEAAVGALLFGILASLMVRLGWRRSKVFILVGALGLVLSALPFAGGGWNAGRILNLW